MLADPATYERCLSLLAPDERGQHNRQQVPAKRLEIASSYALLRLGLEFVTGTAASTWKVRRDSMGRPLVEGPADGMHVSVTRTPGLVACLITARRACGIDAEQLSPRVPYMRIAEQVFSPGEIADLRGLEEKARIERFFVLWSVKEAFAKARGEGLAAPLDKIEVSLEQNGEVNMMMPPEITGGGDAWHVRWSRPSDEHVMATCVHSPDGRRVAVVEHVGLP